MRVAVVSHEYILSWIGSKKKIRERAAISVEPMSRMLKVCADYIKFVQLAA